MSQHLQNKAQLCQILCLTWLLIMELLLLILIGLFYWSHGTVSSQLLLTVNDDAIPAVAFNRRTILTKKDAPGYDSAVSAPFYTTTNRVTNCAGDSRRSLRPRSKSKEDFTKNFATASFATAERPHGRRWTDTNAAVYKIQRRRLQVIQSLVQVQLITTTDKSRPKRERQWALITVRLFHEKNGSN